MRADCWSNAAAQTQLLNRTDQTPPLKHRLSNATGKSWSKIQDSRSMAVNAGDPPARPRRRGPGCRPQRRRGGEPSHATAAPDYHGARPGRRPLRRHEGRPPPDHRSRREVARPGVPRQPCCGCRQQLRDAAATTAAAAAAARASASPTDPMSELVETGSRTKDFVLSFISLAIKFIAGSVIQSVLLTGSQC